MRKSTIAVAAMLCVGLGVAYAGGDVIELHGVKSKTPATWKKEKPSSNLRTYQYALPKADADKEDADLAIFESTSGSLAANVERWKTQFIPPEGKTIDEASNLVKFKVGDNTAAVFDISGTYKKPAFSAGAKEERKPNFRRINVMFETEKGTFFVTLTGPAKTIEKHKESFDGWIKAFK